MTPVDIRTAMFGLLGTAALFSRYTPSKKDDAVVTLLLEIMSKDDLFGEFLVLIGKANGGNVVVK